MKRSNIVKVAIKRSGLKTQKAFAEALNRSQSYVAKCVANGEFPKPVILDVERISGVPRHQLAPELYEGYEPVHVDYSPKSDEGSVANV